MAYSEKVLVHYNNPQNVGTLDKSKTNVGTGLVGAPECGDVMRLQIEVDEVTGMIKDAKFKTFGCGSAIASSSLATEWLKGRTVDEAYKIKNTDIVQELNLPPVKIHCSVLAEDAIKAAKRLQEVQGLGNAALRLGVKGGGCSGLSYTVNFDTEMGPYDQSYEIDGIRIIVDMKSAIYLQGTQLDYQKDLVSGQFKFSNPNAAKSCGCGES